MWSLRCTVVNAGADPGLIDSTEEDDDPLSYSDSDYTATSDESDEGILSFSLLVFALH